MSEERKTTFSFTQHVRHAAKERAFRYIALGFSICATPIGALMGDWQKGMLASFVLVGVYVCVILSAASYNYYEDRQRIGLRMDLEELQDR